MRSALVNARILGDEGWLDDHALILDGACIEAIVPRGERRLATLPTQDLGGLRLLPGFVDVQVNGGGGALFNDSPDVETIRAIARAHRRFGTTSLLPTLITDDTAKIARAIDAARDALRQSVPGVIGVHIEGPCLNVMRKGAHDAAHLRDLDADEIALLSSLRAGRTLVTLAPEMTSPATIATLVANGVRVSAGHTDASCVQMRTALASGVTAFTHLFNAMSPLTSREPGVVGAALSDAASWCGIIVDGHHVDPVVLRLALRCKREDRFMLVTDAMPSVGSNQDHFMLQGRRVDVRDGRCVDASGTLSGSDLDMASAVRNTVRLLGLPLERAARMASTWPAQFLGLDAELGRIAAGLRANLALVDDEVRVHATWIDGERE